MNCDEYVERLTETLSDTNYLTFRQWSEPVTIISNEMLLRMIKAAFLSGQMNPLKPSSASHTPDQPVPVQPDSNSAS